MFTVLHSFPVWLPQTQTWMYNQVRFLPEEVDSHVVCETTENLDQFWLPNIHSLSGAPRRRYYWDKGLRRLRVRRHLGLLTRTARRQRADVLHSHFGDIGWTDLEATRGMRTRHVVTFYGRDVGYLPKLDPVWRERYRELFGRVDLVLCEGPHMARRVVTDLGCPESKVLVHHLGIRVDEIPFEPRVWSPGEPLRVLIAASFQEKKGIPYALEALGRLRREVELEITVIGDAGEEARSRAEKRRILGAIEEQGLGPRVRMLGYRPHAVLFNEAYEHHVFLAPSVTASDGDTEGGAPVGIIEMAATGMPIVGTTHCDIPEVVRHGVTGLLAEERDVADLVRHLRWLLERPEWWKGMVLVGRERVEKEFDARTQGERLGRIYESISGGG